VYPAHGPGTLCGRSLSAETVSTIGAQRAENYALAPMGREEFVRIVTADQPEAPSYFEYDAVLNTRERPTLSESLQRELRPLSLDEVLTIQRDGGQVLDTRPLEQFEAAHLRDSVNIGLDGRYATWCGTVLDRERPLVIVADPGREQESTVRLGRIGFDQVAGYLEGGMAALADHPDLVASIERLAPSALSERLRAGDPPVVIDVRGESEADGGMIEGARNMPLTHLAEAAAELAPDRPVVVYCGTGYRSVIAASVLQAKGFKRVADLAGGIAAWDAAAA
jgi:hydroxyacylglutathione hydrolase